MKKRAKGSPKDRSDSQSTPDKQDTEDNVEPEPEKRAMLYTFDGDYIDITDELKEMIEEAKKKKEQTLFRKIRDKLSKMANGAKKVLKPDERVFVHTWGGKSVDITDQLQKLNDQLREERKKVSKRPKDAQQD